MNETKRLAIEQLERVSKNLGAIGETVDYTELAIEALEQEPCDDAIDRQAAVDIVKDMHNLTRSDVLSEAVKQLKELPPVTPQPKTMHEKQADSEKYQKAYDDGYAQARFDFEPKTGHWIEKDGFDGDVYYDCSECGESWTTIEGTPWNNGMNYCPSCGARMESDAE